MNRSEKDKNDRLLGIVFCTLILAYATTNYNKTYDPIYMMLEIGSIVLLIYTSINYIKLKNKEKKRYKKIAKRNGPKPITPFDKKFKINYYKTNKKYIHQEPVPDAKSQYIQSAWDELGKF